MRAESWTLNEDIAKRVAAFERKVLKRMFGGIRVNENEGMRCTKEVMQLFGGLDTLSFVSRIYINGMESKRKVSHYLTKILS